MYIDFLNESYKVLNVQKDGLLIEAYDNELFLSYEILNEAKSEAPLYRVLGPNGARAAIVNNEFKKGCSYGICFTRDKNYWIGDLDGGTPGVKLFQFRINQYKLASDYKIITIAEKGYQRVNQQSESEERVLQTVKNVDRYLECIDTRKGYVENHLLELDQGIRDYNLKNPKAKIDPDNFKLTTMALKSLERYIDENSYPYLVVIALILEKNIPQGENLFKALSEAGLKNKLNKFNAPKVTSNFKDLEAKIQDIQANITPQPSADAHQNAPVLDLFMQNIGTIRKNMRSEGYEFRKVTDYNWSIYKYVKGNILFEDEEFEMTGMLTPTEIVVEMRGLFREKQEAVKRMIDQIYPCFIQGSKIVFTVPYDITKTDMPTDVLNEICFAISEVPPYYHDDLLDLGYKFNQDKKEYTLKKGVLTILVRLIGSGVSVTVKFSKTIKDLLNTVLLNNEIKRLQQLYNLNGNILESSTQVFPPNAREFTNDFLKFGKSLDKVKKAVKGGNEEYNKIKELLLDNLFTSSSDYRFIYKDGAIEYRIDVHPETLDLHLLISHVYNDEIKDSFAIKAMPMYDSLTWDANGRYGRTVIQYNAKTIEQSIDDLANNIIAVSDAFAHASKVKDSQKNDFVKILSNLGFDAELKSNGRVQGKKSIKGIDVRVTLASDASVAIIKIDRGIPTIEANLELLSKFKGVSLVTSVKHEFFIEDLNRVPDFIKLLETLKVVKPIYGDHMELLKKYGCKVDSYPEEGFIDISGKIDGFAFEATVNSNEKVAEIYFPFSNTNVKTLVNKFKNIKNVYQQEASSSYIFSANGPEAFMQCIKAIINLPKVSKEEVALVPGNEGGILSDDYLMELLKKHKFNMFPDVYASKKEWEQISLRISYGDELLKMTVRLSDEILDSINTTNKALTYLKDIIDKYNGKKASNAIRFEHIPRTKEVIEEFINKAEDFNNNFGKENTKETTQEVKEDNFADVLTKLGFKVQDNLKMARKVYNIVKMYVDYHKDTLTLKIAFNDLITASEENKQDAYQNFMMLFPHLESEIKPYEGIFFYGMEKSKDKLKFADEMISVLDKGLKDLFDQDAKVEDEVVEEPKETPKAVEKPQTVKKASGKEYVVKKGENSLEKVPFAVGQVYEVTKTIKALYVGDEDTYDTYQIQVMKILKSGKVKAKNLTLGYEFTIGTSPSAHHKVYVLIKDAEINKKDKVEEEKPKQKPKEEPKIEEPKEKSEDVPQENAPTKVRKGDLINRVYDLKFKKTGDPDHDEGIDRILAYIKKNQKVLKSRNDIGIWLLDNEKELAKYKLTFPAVVLMFYGMDDIADVKKDPIYLKFHKSKALSIIRHAFKTKDLNGNPCIAVVFYDNKTAVKYKIKLIKESIEQNTLLDVNESEFKVLDFDEESGVVLLESSLGITFKAGINSLNI